MEVTVNITQCLDTEVQRSKTDRNMGVANNGRLNTLYRSKNVRKNWCFSNAFFMISVDSSQCLCKLYSGISPAVRGDPLIVSW